MNTDVDFIANSTVTLLAGLVATVTLVRYAWWLPFVVGLAWGSTHWLLRESAVWRDRATDEVRAAQRDAAYAYRLAVEPPAAKELRLFGLADWTVERFVETRRRLHALQYEATRLRERSVVLALVIVSAAGAGVAVWLSRAELPLDRTVAAAGLVVPASAVAFGGLSWAMDGAAAPVVAVERLGPAMAAAGALAPGTAPPTDTGAPDVRLERLGFRYPRTTLDIYAGLDLALEPGRSMAIVGRNGAGKTTLAKLLCRLYDPTAGAVTVDGTDLRALDVGAWRTRTAAVFQDHVRLELSLRDNVDPAGLATDEQVRTALADAGAAGLVELDTPLSKNYAGGADLSGGQRQKVALARGFPRTRPLVLVLDEPTSALDAQTEHALFQRYATAARTEHGTGRITVLVSHRFSTVRAADLIVVLDGSRVREVGSHAELVAADGLYAELYGIHTAAYR